MTVATKDPKKIDAHEINKGDFMAFTYWGRVEKTANVYGNPKVYLKDLDSNTEFTVEGTDLIADANSANQFSKSEKVTKTQIVDILANAKGVPFRVTFVKANGSLRKLFGRLIGVDKKNLGYIDVEDLEQDAGDRFRLVDCRTIKELIVHNVRYYV